MVKNPPANAGDVGLIPGSGRSPGEGNDNPLQYSCLENPIDRGISQATVHGLHFTTEVIEHALYKQNPYSDINQLFSSLDCYSISDFVG